MKTLNKIIFYILFAISGSSAQSSDRQPNYDAAMAAWELAAHGNQTTTVITNRFQELSQAWENEVEEDRSRTAYYYGRAAVETAKKLADDAKINESALILEMAGNVIKTYGVDLTRGKSKSHFEEMAGLHAKIMASLEADPLLGVPISYELFHHDRFYFAIREGRGTDQSALAEHDSESLFFPGEKEATILRLDSKGRTIQVIPGAITNGNGPLRSRLSAVFEYLPASPNRSGSYLRRGAEFIFTSKPAQHQTPTMEGNAAITRPPLKNSRTAPTSLSAAKPNSSTRLSIIGMVVAITLGLLWLVFKRKE